MNLKLVIGLIVLQFSFSLQYSLQNATESQGAGDGPVRISANSSQQAGGSEQNRPIIQYNFAVPPTALPALMPENPPIAIGMPGKRGPPGRRGPRGDQGVTGPRVRYLFKLLRSK